MFDGEAFGKQMVEIVKGHVERATAPLLERIDALERREPLTPEKGDKGDAGEVDMVAVEALIAKAVASIELPQPEPGPKGEKGEKGDSVELDMIEIRSIIVDEVARIERPSDGSDGVGLADALIDHEGNLVLTMTDGRIKTLGMVKGADGRDGDNGRDGHTFTLDDFDVQQIDERSFKFCFTKGSEMHSFEFAFPVVLDRGVWNAEKTYAQGDTVSWAGSLWIAQRSEPGKPDTADSGWRLAVKKGRDGKDAK